MTKVPTPPHPHRRVRREEREVEKREQRAFYHSNITPPTDNHKKVTNLLPLDNVTFTEGNPTTLQPQPGQINPSPHTTTTPLTPTAHGEPPNPNRKPRVVVLGSGWAGLRFVEAICTDLYDVVVVSPRNVRLSGIGFVLLCGVWCSECFCVVC